MNKGHLRRISLLPFLITTVSALFLSFDYRKSDTIVIDGERKVLELKNHLPTPESVWHKITFQNNSFENDKFYLSIAFADSVFLVDKNSRHTSITGDKIPLNQRAVKTGQICFLPLTIPKGRPSSFLIKTVNKSAISSQFRDFTTNSLKLYSPEKFEEVFMENRYFQAFFYGAVCIMFFFNLFILFSLRIESYLYYLVYLLSLTIFFLSNSGYLLEFIIPEYPTTDLYIRFLSTPVVMFFYLQFGLSYLQGRKNILKLFYPIRIVQYSFVLFALIMLAGYWKTGRMLIIVSSISGFILIIAAAFKVWKKGYSPALYFLAGNLFLISGAVYFATERIFTTVAASNSNFVVQNAVLVELALFSLGLANKFNVLQNQLNRVRVEKEVREKEIQRDKAQLIKEKNKELELSNRQLDLFIYRTAHDIRGPLATLMGLCHVGQLETKDKTALSYLEKMGITAKRLNNILARLNLAYNISNHEIFPEELHLQKLISGIINDTGMIVDSQDAEINLKIPDHLTICTDFNLLKFLLSNLIENALKFQNYDMEYVHQVWIEATEKNDHLYMTIANNGEKIPEEEAPFIFDLFSKAATKYKTPGLGLYMVKICLQKLNGNIEYSYVDGKTIFKFVLPLKYINQE